ncbi:MAG: primosomal protein N' [Clostridia bacterium]|nr:primosomal protein N' [Clostridia bacterium]
MIARVILNANTLSTDRLYDYLIPINFEPDVKVGTRVKVPFGKGNRTKEAYVLYVCDKTDYNCELKMISDVISKISYFTPVDVELMEFMRHRYFCSYISAVKCFVPAGLNMKFSNSITLSNCDFAELKKYTSKSKVADKIVSCLLAYGTMSEEALKLEVGKMNLASALKKLESKGYISISLKETESVSDSKKIFVQLLAERNDVYNIIDSIENRAPARARVLEVLCDNYDIELSELLVYAETSKATVDALVEKGLVSYKTVVCNDSYISFDESYIKPKPVLTFRQKEVLKTISEGLDSGNKHSYLIHGVTGSGKTEIYLSLLEKALSKNLDSILLVPEISLTPQMIGQIFGRFGDNVAVLHSKLTLKQRFVEWNKIKSGEVKIVVGARSAVFAPFKKIGLIIIDEEHESTYKSEMSPRYNAIEIARFITSRENGCLVLASATPSVDSYYKAKTNSFKLLELPERVNKAPLPSVEIADMRNELADGNLSIFSSKLKNAMDVALSKKEQIILFLNRRGFSGFVSCRDCGFAMKCPTCSVSLTYHKSINKMVCHYCDYKTSVKKTCPECNGKHIRFFGIGTEKVVDELSKIYPQKKILRMDADTTSGRFGHENILTHFKNGDADILVGTQMITKGLDFDNVTLVGIIAADMSLNLDDYRAQERTFDLITQVIGRAGRAKKQGKAIIQTYNPEDDTIVLSGNQDYKSFYEEEIIVRRLLMYPPFTEFIKIQFSGNNKSECKTICDKFYKDLNSVVDKNTFVGEIFNVSESPLFRINGKYRYRFIIKTPYKKEFYNTLHSIYQKYLHNNNVSIMIDVNPVNSY